MEAVRAALICASAALICSLIPRPEMRLGVVIAALLLSIGVWKTLFVVVLGAVGLFLGGVKDKPGAVKALVNRLFPPKE